MYQKLRIFPILIFITLTVMSCQESASTSNKAMTANEPKKIEQAEKLLRHVVLFKFKKESTAEEINQLNEAFNALPAAIPEIKDFEWGLNDSPENFHQDFTHCYLLTFESEEDRDSIYAPHPAHKAFGESLGPHLDGVFVVDYWTNP